MKARELPSQERLQYLCYYNPKTGKFYARFTASNGAKKIGRTAKITSNGYYERIWIDKERYQVHRLIWMYVYGVDPGNLEIDHIDRDPSNNRLDNLRLATHKQNKENSGGKGYYLHKPSQKYCAFIHINNRNKNLGYFTTEADARAAYLKAKKELHPFYNDTIQQA